MSPDRGGLRVALAYLSVCVVWGSTYIAIRVGVQHLPPALMAGIRHLAAGTALLVFIRATGRSLPTRMADWRTNAIIGVLLLGIANGLVVWSEQFIGAGMASIFVVTVSLWLALFDAIVPGSKGRATPLQALGLLVGFGGTLLLVGTDLETLRHADWRGPIGLTLASISWAAGSIFSQRRPVQSGPYVNASIQMLAGGIALTAVGTLRGEWATLAINWQGIAAFSYLVVFGSLVGFTAFVYILQVLPATIAGTYVYANTVVAVLLGWALLHEPVGARTVVAMSVVIGAVVLVKYAARPRTPSMANETVPLPEVTS